MTRDDMIRLAHEAGWGYANNQDGYDPLWKFGELIAAAEREACARACEVPIDLIQITDDCSEYVYKDHLDCAEAIRARGQ